MGSASSSSPCLAGMMWRKGPTCVVLLRHGQREDYVAYEEGQGAEWVASSPRPWDPCLAAEGFAQAELAAERLRVELRGLGLPPPSCIYSSPLVRCVETAGVVANHFGIPSILVEEGLVETICEAWFRQWAVPGANTKWGGPPGASMARPVAASECVQGPPVEEGLRAEARQADGTLFWTAPQLANLVNMPCAKMVAAHHESVVSIRGGQYCWGHFETRAEVTSRALETVTTRAAQYPGRTLVFVSHGSPTQNGYYALVGERVPEKSGGMTAMSILRRAQVASGLWEPLVKNDVSHTRAENALDLGAVTYRRA